MYKDKVTVYTPYYVEKKKYWRQFLLSGVDLNIDRARLLKTYGEASQGRALLHIKYKPTATGYYIGNLAYTNVFNGEEGLIGFSENESFFIEGHETATADVEDSAYTDGFFDYCNASKDAFIMTSVARFSVIPHIEIVAR